MKIDYIGKDEEVMEEYISEIEQICKQATPPKPQFKPICKSCAFYEYCFS